MENSNNEDIKKRYCYYIAYNYDDGSNTGKGSMNYSTSIPIEYGSDVTRANDYIKKVNSLKYCVIIFYKEIKGLDRP